LRALPSPRALVSPLAVLAAVFTALVPLGCGDGGDGGDPAGNTGDDVASACVRSAACGIRAYPRVRECLALYTSSGNKQSSAIYTPMLACINGAASCNAVAACHGRGQTCSTGFTAFCDGAAAISCDLLDGRTYRLDCAAVGASCKTGGGLTATCTSATKPDDPLTGLECPGGACQPVGGSCGSDALDRCSADGGLEACLGGEWVRFDCAALGLRPCERQPLGFGRCGRAI
jgi:hypothetical protein